MKVNPQWLRELGAGEAYVIHGGKFRYVAATMSAAGYVEPSGEAVEQVIRALEVGRRLDELPEEPARPALPEQKPRAIEDQAEEDQADEDPANWN